MSKLKNHPRIHDYFAQALTLTKQHYWMLLLNCITYFVVAACLCMTGVGIIAFGGIYAGFTKLLVNAARNKQLVFCDSMSYGFYDGRWWKSIAFILLTLLARVGPAIIAAGLFLFYGKDFWSGLASISAYSTFAIIAVLIAYVLFVVYFTTVWMFGVYFLVDHRITILQMFASSHALVKKAGFWDVFFTVLLLAVIPSIIASFLPKMVMHLFYAAIMPYLSLVTASIYVLNTSNKRKTSHKLSH